MLVDAIRIVYWRLNMINFKTYTNVQLFFALADCHATLEIGKYSADHPYGRKLWAEIDAIRDEQLARLKATSKKSIWRNQAIA